VSKHDLEVTIDEEGNVTLEAHGIQGKACLSVLGELVQKLGKGAAPVPTKEMHQTAKNGAERAKGGSK